MHVETREDLLAETYSNIRNISPLPRCAQLGHLMLFASTGHVRQTIKLHPVRHSGSSL